MCRLFFCKGVRVISDFAGALRESISMLTSFSPELYGIIFLSLRVTMTALVLASIIGVPTGVVLGLKHFPGRAVVINIVNTFMSLPPVVAGLVVYVLLSNRTGLVGARAYAELYCSLVLRPGAGLGELNNVQDPGVRGAMQASPFYGGSGVLDRVSFNRLNDRRNSADSIYWQFLRDHG